MKLLSKCSKDAVAQNDTEQLNTTIGQVKPCITVFYYGKELMNN